MWRGLFKKTKESGLSVIDTYVFWNEHEKVQGVFDFSGRRNLRQFIIEAQQEGLMVNLRVGPYICAEVNYGGFPIWLHEIPGIAFRTNNEIFKREMMRFVRKILTLVDDLLYENGGPIIMMQIENEYGNVQKDYGPDGKKYIDWAVGFAQNLTQKAQWIVCEQGDQPSLPNACNGFYCEDWMDNRRYKTQVGIWEELWTGWFQAWGQSKPIRPVEDISFSVARFLAKGGTYIGYYMWHGGTNFGRSSGGPFLITSYNYDAPLDEYGLKNEPKYSHLALMHSVVNKYAETILANKPVYKKLGFQLESHSFGNFEKDSGLALLSNLNTVSEATVSFGTATFTLPKWSVTFVSGGTNPKTLFCTAKITVESSTLIYRDVSIPYLDIRAIPELVGNVNALGAVTAGTLQEQVVFTHDQTDYLNYQTTVEIPESVSSIEVTFKSVEDMVFLWLDKRFEGLKPGGKSVTFNISGRHPKAPMIVNVVTQTMGLKNYDAKFDIVSKGIIENVMINKKVILPSSWTLTAGLKGELNEYFRNPGIFLKVGYSVPDVENVSGWTWYKVTFPAIESMEANGQFAVDLGSMGKGQVYLNGQALGRYWNITGHYEMGKDYRLGPKEEYMYKNMANFVEPPCDYAGKFGYQWNFSKCRIGSGKASQRYYHVPAEWVNYKEENTLIIFEELGGDLSKIRIVSVSRN